MGDSISTVNVAARQGHIQAARGSSGTASFGVGYNASDDASADDIEREYNLRASQIKARFEESGRQGGNLPKVDHRMTDSIMTGSLNDRDEVQDDEYD